MMTFALEGRVLENDRRFTNEEDYTMFKRIPAAALIIALGLGSHAATASTAMELQTAKQEVPGTREVEAGKFDAAIAKLDRALIRTNHSLDRAPVLVNLCAALTGARQFDRAAEVCDAAIANGVSLELAYNNRAVLNALRGEAQAAVADLEKAALLRPGTKVVKRNLDRARNVASTQIVAS